MALPCYDNLFTCFMISIHAYGLANFDMARCVNTRYLCIVVMQLSRIIYLFSSNMHDASLSLGIHTTCARLMLNLVSAQT